MFQRKTPTLWTRIFLYCVFTYQGLSQDLECGCPKLTVIDMKFVGVLFFLHSMIWDYSHKHEFTYWNKAKYPYTISWESYGAEKKLYVCNWHFQILLTNNLVSWGAIFEGLGVQMTQTLDYVTCYSLFETTQALAYEQYLVGKGTSM